MVKQYRYDGEPLKVYCDRMGLSYDTIYKMLKKGYSIEEALKKARMGGTTQERTIMNYCKFCGKQPHMVVISDCYYVQCSCGKHYKYEFLGYRRAEAIQAWNAVNKGILPPQNAKKK